ncbi:MAG: flagellar export chaperone FliS, partial [Firmicutes bacterium]|nr:flagellar export chaperone FliS [Bacillota bacterium]
MVKKGMVLMGNNPYARYQKIQVETADQGRLLLMLYAGALRFLNLAKKALNNGDLEGTNHNLLRVQDIIAELTAALNFEVGEVAGGLQRLYDYISFLLLQGNIKKEIKFLEQAEALLKDLQASWREILGEKQTAVQGGKTSPAGRTGATG